VSKRAQIRTKSKQSVSRRSKNRHSKPLNGRGSSKDWLNADPYVRAYLATHAAEASRLDELLTDPRFLVAAEVSGLVGVLHHAESMDARVAADVYELASHNLEPEAGRATAQPNAVKQPILILRDRNLLFAERASYLAMIARQQGADELAEGIEELNLDQRWAVRWARWRAASANRIIYRHQSEVRTVAVGKLDGRSVIVSGGSEGTVRVWDLARGTPLYEPLTGNDHGVSAVAVCELKARPLILSGGGPTHDGTVRVWDLERATPLYEPLTGHDNWVVAVAVGELKGRPLIVSGGEDQTVRVWDLARGERRLTIEVGCQAHSVAIASPSSIVFGASKGLMVIDSSADLGEYPRNKSSKLAQNKPRKPTDH
jgi:hypothetical protein